MPNWCENELMIAGPAADLRKFMKLASEGGQDKFEGTNRDLRTTAFIPVPDDIKDNHTVEWAVENWGTKWGICDSCLVSDEADSGEITYDFSTAWSPALPVVQRMSEMFPSLTFAYMFFEGGVGFCGIYEFKEGNEVYAHDGEYSRGRGG